MKKMLPVVGMVLLAACGHKEEPAKKGAAVVLAPVPVQVAKVAAAEWPTAREVVGTVRARNTASVSSRIMAYVREVRVSQGDVVRAGQVLVTLDSKDLDTAQRQALEGQREAQSAEAEVESAIRAAKAQRELAQVTFDRMKGLFEKKSISNQEFDEAQARLRLAQANVEMAEAKRKQLDARIAQAKEQVQIAGIQQGYAQITAPFAGVVSEKRVEPGNLATPGAPLLLIEQVGSYRLETPLDESLLPSVKRGMAVEVRLEALDKTVRATVSEIVPAIDAATRTVTVKLELPGVGNLRSGMSGRASFGAGAEQVVVTPVAAVRSEGSLQLAFVVDGGVARTRMVTLGERRGDVVRVLSGLKVGEEVVSPIPGDLRDGGRAEVRR
ncbi:MAG: efflux RND transporter periplasmic adaptor subunit [Bryobacterales bacterium]|nr:efflux RND transporter periplasmic adaptor subunit [Bryobacterales bacterium]